MPERGIRAVIVMTLAASAIGCRTDRAPADLSPASTPSTSTTEDTRSPLQEGSLDLVDFSNAPSMSPIPACSIVAEASRDQTKTFNCKLEIE
jgi:hypothetical protein